MSVFRIYVEKKSEFAAQAKGVLADIKSSLSLQSLTGLRIINRYDVQGITKENFDKAVSIVFSEPTVDDVSYELPTLGEDERLFAVEYLPGQFDQRADSCEQCIQLLVQGERPVVKNARLYLFSGKLSDREFTKVKEYLVNPVESRAASLEVVDDLTAHYEIPTTVATLEGFIGYSKERLNEFLSEYGLAMDLDDILFCQGYFANEEKRDPTITEIRMIDTYWSDHCRHTTFSTNIDNITIENPYINDTFNEYKKVRDELYKDRNDKPITLMDMATIGAKWLKKQGLLNDLDESEEINACSVKIKVEVEGGHEDWLLMFKNETHNHPTEIEPFGGAATCLGGAIRDPLSGRSYVYQAMRVTGAADPFVPMSETVRGKLPQRKIIKGAADGYSSYGNQIGLATGHVAEIYHPGYVAKRMEIGAVIGAAPIENVVREVPCDGDVVILLGGKTGRDGCGGATGSSKSHTLESLESCGAEVQKGNPPEERKLQRLFRKKEVTSLIKRCNDFGAGGISVAIGELADGLEIELDRVPKKYDGLDGTELAISESQERMACVVAKEDADRFIKAANEENIQATLVATVTATPRLRMNWEGRRIVDLARSFLNSNGATKVTDVKVTAVSGEVIKKTTLTNTQSDWERHLSDLNIASQKGLVEHFDSTIGARTVLMPFGGEYQLTPSQSMVAKIPVEGKETSTCSVMSYGFNPYISEASPYHGAIYAVVESVAKVVAVGGDHEQCWLTFQEYFERTKNDPTRWGKPFSALLGALKAQWELSIGSIGGKDSMSGTFEDIDVPPTLVSFAVSLADSGMVVSNEIKQIGSTLAIILPKYDENGIPDFADLKSIFSMVRELIAKGYADSVQAITYGGLSESLFKMCLGNRFGVKLNTAIDNEVMFNPCYGGFVIEFSNTKKIPECMTVIGKTTSKYYIFSALDGFAIDLKKVTRAYENRMEEIFPYQSARTRSEYPLSKARYKLPKSQRLSSPIKVASPRVLIPVFPGTNCEYDTAMAFQQAGGKAEVFVINTLSHASITESVDRFAKLLDNSQILMLPGGFSGGDEPDGSAKFICAFLRNPQIKEAIDNLLLNRDGLALGICNGFQALIKLGLVPCGRITDITEDSPTLTFNTINRHQSMMVSTRIASNKSPWLYNTNVGDTHTIPISHGEGRFVASNKTINKMIENGQIATQYINLDSEPTYDLRFNPNGSVYAIEGITSPDGRVLGKMGHSERIGKDICKNVEGFKDQLIFKSGVEYFTK